MGRDRFDRWPRVVGRAATRRGVAKAAGGGLLAAALAGRAGVAPAVTQDATPGGCPATIPEENKALVERYWAEVWTAGGEGAIPGVLAPDEVHHWGVGGDTVGREGFRERLRRFLDAFPDLAVRVEHLVAEGGPRRQPPGVPGDPPGRMAGGCADRRRGRVDGGQRLPHCVRPDRRKLGRGRPPRPAAAARRGGGNRHPARRDADDLAVGAARLPA